MDIKKLYDAKWIKLYDIDSYILATRREEKDLAIYNKDFCDGVKLASYYEKDGKYYIVFIKEFRKNINDYIFSLPAGLVDKGETIEQALVREAKEEIGATLTDIERYAPPCYLTIGLSDETMATYFAKITSFGEQHLEQTEDITLYPVCLDDIDEFFKNNPIDMTSLMLADILRYKLRSK